MERKSKIILISVLAGITLTALATSSGITYGQCVNAPIDWETAKDEAQEKVWKIMGIDPRYGGYPLHYGNVKKHSDTEIKFYFTTVGEDFWLARYNVVWKVAVCQWTMTELSHHEKGDWYNA